MITLAFVLPPTLTTTSYLASSMSNPKRVQNDQKRRPPRRGHFLAAHIMLYMIAVVRFVMALYDYISSNDTLTMINWTILSLPPALVLLSR